MVNFVASYKVHSALKSRSYPKNKSKIFLLKLDLHYFICALMNVCHVFVVEWVKLLKKSFHRTPIWHHIEKMSNLCSENGIFEITNFRWGGHGGCKNSKFPDTYNLECKDYQGLMCRKLSKLTKMTILWVGVHRDRVQTSRLRDIR